VPSDVDHTVTSVSSPTVNSSLWGEVSSSASVGSAAFGPVGWWRLARSQLLSGTATLPQVGGAVAGRREIVVTISPPEEMVRDLEPEYIRMVMTSFTWSGYSTLESEVDPTSDEDAPPLGLRDIRRVRGRVRQYERLQPLPTRSEDNE
jgi:hypothetical protein